MAKRGPGFFQYLGKFGQLFDNFVVFWMFVEPGLKG
jgi:hypothetical protein